ncbi:MAG: methylaspartate mutase subunit E [Spirochaetales bacterium]
MKGLHRMSKEEFFRQREEVLASWPTGAGLQLQEAFAYQKKIPENRRFSFAMEEAKKKRKLLTQPRAGVALPEEHIRLLKYLETEGEADLLPTTIDAYTRQNRYREAEEGIEKSKVSGKSLLNGFPAVNHGVAVCREVTEAVTKPVQVRHGTPDARLLAEITLAGGFTSFEGGGVSYNIPYAKKVPLEQSLQYWRYVDALVGYYEEEGISINREPFGPLTGTLVPPCISHAVGILEGLFALAQGVKSITLGYGQGGNLIQDVAAIKSLRQLAEEYFQEAGFTDYQLTLVFHQWMGGFPEDESKAFAVISWGTAAAVFSGAEKVIVKSPHEAYGIPTKEANAAGLRCTRQLIHMLQDQSMPQSQEVEREVGWIRKEVKALLDGVWRLGNGDWEAGTVRAFQAGVLDVPFAPSLFNVGKILPARDNEGYIRILQPGNLPFDKEILDHHRGRLEERAKAEGRSVNFQMVTDDIYAISKGHLVGRPRGG